MGIRICPKCGGKVSTSRNDCIHCGYVFPTTKTCPDCGEEIDINAKECPICGYPFEQSAPKEAAPSLEEVKEEPALEEVKEEPALEEVKEEPELVEAAHITPIKTVETVSQQVVASGSLTCPYCNGLDLMEIGNDFFMCNTCRGRFLNTSDQKASSVIEAAPVVEAIAVAPAIEAPIAQNVLEEVKEEPALEEVKETSEPINETPLVEETNVLEEVKEEPVLTETNKEQVEKASEEENEEVAPVSQKASKEEHFKKDSKNKKIFIAAGAVLVVVALTFAVLIPTVFIPKSHYDKGMSLVVSDPDKAAEEFQKCPNWSDSYEQFQFAYARKSFKQGKYEEGIDYMLDGGGTVIVNFESSNNLQIESQVLTGKAELHNPEVGGYKFSSWTFKTFVFSEKNHKVTLNFDTTWKALSYSFIMTFRNSSYGSVYVNNNLANSASSYSKKFTTGSEIALKAIPNSGRSFSGWYVDNELLSSEKNYTLIMPGHDYNIVAKFS